MKPTLRLAFRILALALAIGVLVFVVSRGARPKPPAPAAAAEPTSMPAEMMVAPEPATSASNRYDVIGPATKANPFTVRRAVESLATPAPSGSGSASPAERR